MLDQMRGLRAFVRAADLGSFAAAGVALDLTASAVSKAVAVLEASLGVRLFARSARGLALTDDGQRFLLRCRVIEAELDAAQREFSHGRTAVRGSLRVLLEPGPARARVVAAMPQLLARYPELDLAVTVAAGLPDLEAAGGDVAVIYGEPPALPGYVSRRLVDSEYLTCAAPSYLAARGIPQAPEDLAQHACLLYVAADGQAHDRWQFANDDRHCEVRVQPLLSVNDGPSLVAAAMAGHGIVHLPAINLAARVRSGALVQLLPAWFSECPPLIVLIAPGRRGQAKVRVFIDFLLDLFADVGPGTLKRPASHRARAWSARRARGAWAAGTRATGRVGAPD